MKCSNCNKEISENIKFCTFCGTEVKREQEASVCPYCNAKVNQGEAFCTSCGKKLGAPVETPKPQRNVAAPNVAAPIVPNVMPTSANTAKSKGKSPVLYVVLGMSIALLIGAIAFLVITLQKDDKSNANTPANGETSVNVAENNLTLNVDETPSEVAEDTYVISGSASVSGNEAVLSINGEEIETIYADDGEVYWSEEVSLEEGHNSFNIRLRDKDSNYKIKIVKIKYTAPEEEEEFLFPSDSEYITNHDLVGKTKEEVALIRNEIYARHGYVFNTEAYQEYFSQKSWYEPNPDFSEAQLNEIEIANKDFLVGYEESRGWR